MFCCGSLYTHIYLELFKLSYIGAPYSLYNIAKEFLRETCVLYLINFSQKIYTISSLLYKLQFALN